MNEKIKSETLAFDQPKKTASKPNSPNLEFALFGLRYLEGDDRAVQHLDVHRSPRIIWTDGIPLLFSPGHLPGVCQTSQYFRLATSQGRVRRYLQNTRRDTREHRRHPTRNRRNRGPPRGGTLQGT